MAGGNSSPFLICQNRFLVPLDNGDLFVISFCCQFSPNFKETFSQLVVMIDSSRQPTQVDEITLSRAILWRYLEELIRKRLHRDLEFPVLRDCVLHRRVIVSPFTKEFFHALSGGADTFKLSGEALRSSFSSSLLRKTKPCGDTVIFIQLKGHITGAKNLVIKGKYKLE